MSSSGIVPLTVLTKPSVDFASGTSDPEVVPSCPTLTFSPNGALIGSISTIPSPDINIFLWGGIVIGSRSTLSGCDPDPSLKVPSADGTLRDGSGSQPLSVDLEPITIPPHRKIFISGDGIVEIEPINAPLGEKVRVGQLGTTSGSEVPLAKSTDGFVRTVNGTIPELDNRTRLLSGFLEGSNVKSVDELVTGIDQSRAYEINVKFISTAQEIDEASASLMRMPS